MYGGGWCRNKNTDLASLGVAKIIWFLNCESNSYECT